MKLTDYILLPREVRIAHIDLSTPCNPQGARARNNKKPCLELLGIVNDVDNWVVANICRCHLCDCDSTKGWCGNPLHFYIGTGSENTADHRAANPDYVAPYVQGVGLFINESGVLEAMRSEEAKARGLKGSRSGQATVFDPSLGQCVSLTPEEAKARGLRGANAGRIFEGQRGLGNFYDPLLGRNVRLPTDEAKARGLRSPNAGRTFEKLECPHCGTEAAAGVFGRYHGERCIERVGSDRWLAAQEKAALLTI